MKKKRPLKLPNKKRQQKEFNHQAAVFDLAKAYETQQPELQLMTGSMNGVRLTPGQAAKAKRSGLKAGFPDIHLPVARGRWFGLYIEMKTDEGRASPAQLRVAQALRLEGYAVEFVVGSKLAWDTIQRYLSFPKLQIRQQPKEDDVSEKKKAAQLPADRLQNETQMVSRAPGDRPGGRL